MKPIKPIYLFAVASFMLTQAALLLLGSALHFAAMPSAMDFGPFNSSHFFMAWHFSAAGGLSHMLLTWVLGTVLFALILWLFLKLGGESAPFVSAGAPSDGQPEDAASPCADPAEPAAVPPTAQAAPPVAAGPVPQSTLYAPRSDDGTGLGIVSVICGCIGFIPGLGMLFAIAGIITGALGNMRAGAAGNGSGRTLSIIGIALSAISLLLMISTVVFLGSLFDTLFGTMV